MDAILGINTQMFIDNGIWGVVTLIAIIVGKIWIIPSISKVLENRFNQGSQVLTKLDVIIKTLSTSINTQNDAISNFHNEINTAHSTRNNIEKKLDLLLGEHIGTLDEKLALNTFASTVHKQHLTALCFYNLRVSANGIDTNRHAIVSRYSRKSEEVSGKTNAQLSHYFHDGYPLSHFFGGFGHIYFRQVFDSLFLAHEALYKTPDDAYTLEDIEAALERNVSRLMSAFKKWLHDKSYTCEIASNTYNFDLWQDSSDFELF